MEEGHDLVGGWGTDHRGQSGSRTSQQVITIVLVSENLTGIGGLGTGQVVKSGRIWAMC